MRETFGERLRKVRKEKGLTQLQLSEKAGVQQALICYYEKNKFAPTLTTFEWLCDALGVSATELLGY